MKILLAYDGMEYSEPALEEAASLAKENDADVTAFSVITEESRPSRSGYVATKPHARDDVAHAHRYLRERGLECEMKTATGDPGEEIVREAREGRYDIIVTGTRGRGPIARMLTGSVSHKVADGAPCTVLIVSDEHRVRVEPRVRVEARIS